MMADRAFREPLRETLIRSVVRQGWSRAWIERALTKWEAGALAEPCEEEERGKPYGEETGCACQGCFERRSFALFAMVTRSLPQLGTPM